MKPKLYAIDYGTSNSLLHGANAKETSPAHIDPASTSPNILKSMIYCQSSGDWSFGEEAVERYINQPTQGRIFKSLKRFLPDASFEGTRVFHQHLSLQDMIAKQLRIMRERANEYFDADVTQSIMGCPALFSSDPASHELALKRLEAAAISAGFKYIQFCPEPIAAAYKFRHTLTEEHVVLIADFGGGTSDFTIIKMDRHGFKQEDILSLGGGSLAGDRFDSDIMEHIISPHLGSRITYKRPMGSNTLGFPKGLIKKMSSPADIVFLNNNSIREFLKDAKRYITNENDIIKLENLSLIIQDFLGYDIFRSIESSKVQLSSHQVSDFSYEYPSISIQESITREGFETASSASTKKILDCLDRVIVDAGLESSDIDIVCLTGGTANIPAIKSGLLSRFGDKIKLSDQFQSVVQGLADHAQSLDTF